MCNCPEGADLDPKAPWNEKIKPCRLATVTVSVVMSKTISFMTDSYTEEYNGKDEDGDPDISVEFENLREEAMEHIALPEDVSNILTQCVNDNLEHKTRVVLNSLIDQMGGWNIDDLEVIEE